MELPQDMYRLKTAPDTGLKKWREFSIWGSRRDDIDIMVVSKDKTALACATSEAIEAVKETFDWIIDVEGPIWTDLSLRVGELGNVMLNNEESCICTTEKFFCPFCQSRFEAKPVNMSCLVHAPDGPTKEILCTFCHR